MWKMKNDLTKFKEQIVRENEKIDENNKIKDVLSNKIHMLKSEVNNTVIDMEKKKDIFERARKRLSKISETLSVKKPDFKLEDSALGYEISIVKEQTRNMYMKNAIFALINENYKLKNILSNSLPEHGINVPSRQQSEKMDSVSHISISSKKSLISEKYIK